MMPRPLRHLRPLAASVLLVAALVQAGTPLLAAAPLWHPPAALDRTRALPAWTLTAFCAPAGWVLPTPADGRDAGPLKRQRPGAPWCPLCLLPAPHLLLPKAPPMMAPLRVAQRLPQASPAPAACPALAHLRLPAPRAPPPLPA